MKKIILLSISVVYSISCMAQLTHTSEFIKLNLPNGAYKLNKQQMDALPGKKPITKMDEQIKPPYVYNIDNIILSLRNVNQDSINNNMAGNKRFLDELYSSLKHHGNDTYKSIIKSVGNKKALIISYTTIDSHYRFYVQNAAKTLTLAGKIDYKEADSAKAEALLNEVINNIQFTK